MPFLKEQALLGSQSAPGMEYYCYCFDNLCEVSVLMMYLCYTSREHQVATKIMEIKGGFLFMAHHQPQENWCILIK